jgi:hypothetical protein
MSQPIRTLARILLVPAALAAVAFAGQSAASASTASHRALPSAHFLTQPNVHLYAQPQVRWANGKWS